MSEEVKNYKCPSCGAPLHYDAESGEMKCDYCGSSFPKEDIEKIYEAENAEEKADDTVWNTAGLSDNWGEGSEQLRMYVCPSCGAELITDETTAATSCPYCGNNAIIPGQLSGVAKPDYIIPFKTTKKEAIQALKEHYRGKILLPKAFKKENHVQEIKGIYVPFWMYSGEAEADCIYHTTRSITTTEGDYRVTRTSHYHVRRKGSLSFSKVPVDASKKMPDDLMDSIEPFDYDEIKGFSLVYLPGFLADKYDESAEDCAARADERCRNSAIGAMRASVFGYQTVVPIRERVYLRRGDVAYALLPVWLLTTQWRGKTYMFAMNGESGKMIGDLPINIPKAIGLAILIYAIVFIIVWFIIGGSV